MNKLNISMIERFMFKKDNMEQLFNTTENNVSDTKQTKDYIPSKKVQHDKSNDEQFLLPKQKDTLFWCYYIMVYGQFKYETLGENSFGEEKRVKLSLAETVKDNKEILKKNKWKKNNIENTLVMENEISLQTFFYICEIKHLNVILQYKRCLYTCKHNATDIYNVITWNNEIGYMIFCGTEQEKKCVIDDYMSSFWIVENINKPLGAISSYKVGALIEICTKLQLPIQSDNGKKLIKKVLYSNIISNI